MNKTLRALTLLMSLVAAASLSSHRALAGGNGTHGGKMALCFFIVDETHTLDGRVPDNSAPENYFEKPSGGEGWKFKAGARESARGKFVATPLETRSLLGDDTALITRKWSNLSFSEALKQMHDEFRRVPKFYRMILSTRNYIPIIADPTNRAATHAADWLPSIDDAGDYEGLPANCVPIQAAWRQSGKISYDELIWNTAKEAQRAVLQLHEELYYLGDWFFDHQTSQFTQQVITNIAQGVVRTPWLNRAQDQAGNRPSDPKLAEQWDRDVRTRAREDDLSDLLSNRDVLGLEKKGDDRFGYYPTLHSLNSLLDQIEFNRVALHRALSTISDFCDVGGQSKKRPSNSGPVKGYDFQFAATSLPGIITNIRGMDAPRKKIQNLIDRQADVFPGAKYNSDDPENQVLRLSEQLGGTATKVDTGLAHIPASPKAGHFGTDPYCKAAGPLIPSVESELTAYGEQVERLNFMWDSSLKFTTSRP